MSQGWTVSFHHITQMRPLILTCHRHLFNAWKSDSETFSTFANLTTWHLLPYLDWAFCKPKKWGLGWGEKWHPLLIWLRQVRWPCNLHTMDKNLFKLTNTFWWRHRHFNVMTLSSYASRGVLDEIYKFYVQPHMYYDDIIYHKLKQWHPAALTK